MVWHLIAAIFAGLAAAGIGLTLRVISGKRLPRWIVPVFADLGMLAYQIHHEYSWFSYKQQQLPDSTEIVSFEKGGAFWRPWTYMFPMTISFSVVDTANLRARETDDQRLVEFILYRFKKEYVDQVSQQAWLMNCATREMLPLEGEARTSRTDEMRRFEQSSPLFHAICKES
ncbi:hypothetical protein [Halomonas sp.]|uniref:hypothetical protein n=1 Tax=Halomonas sp. TaxID=1486246 RepID=UPI00356AB8FC